MKKVLRIVILFFLIGSFVTIDAATSESIYSNLVQDRKETGDCSGYTVRIVGNILKQRDIYFTAHEGSCSIKGEKVEDVDYDSKHGFLSFAVPFESSEGRAYYRFKGNVSKSSMKGIMKIEYPSNSKYNESEKIELKRTSAKQLFPSR